MNKENHSSSRNLVHVLEGKILELYSVEDSDKPRVMMEAVYEGSLAGSQI